MKLTIDTDSRTLLTEDGATVRTMELYGPEALAALSRHWLRVAWSQKHSYTFSWLGRPLIQLPEDVLRLQEVIYHLQPDVIVETGIAHGGSQVFYASLCQLMGKGRVIGVDIEIRPHNRAAIEAHPLRPLITLIEGSSTDSGILDQVKALIRPGERVMVLLDSNHSYGHVSEELRLYAELVTPGSYLVVQDGIMHDLSDVPGGRPEWTHDNPARAAMDFAAGRTDFILEPPPWAFNESALRATGLTHWPAGWLKKRLSD
jgi:cephalosporin hydroxylase